MPELTPLAISAIRRDGGTQPRASIHVETTREYAQAMKDGADLGAPVVFYDGAQYWLADGFHRVIGWMHEGKLTMECDVRQGTREDAILYSAGANSKHGMRRTNEDKRRGVLSVLTIPRFRDGMTLDEIARHCDVSLKFVKDIQGELDGTKEKVRPRRELFPDEAPNSSVENNPANATGLVGKAEIQSAPEDLGQDAGEAPISDEEAVIERPSRPSSLGSFAPGKQRETHYSDAPEPDEDAFQLRLPDVRFDRIEPLHVGMRQAAAFAESVADNAPADLAVFAGWARNLLEGFAGRIAALYSPEGEE